MRPTEILAMIDSTQSGQMDLPLPEVPLYQGEALKLRNSAASFHNQMAQDYDPQQVSGLSIPDIGRQFYGTKSARFCPRFFGAVDMRPYQNLAKDLMRQALVDLRTDDPELFGEALFWLNEIDNVGCFSLPMFGSIFNLPPASIRKGIAAKVPGYELRDDGLIYRTRTFVRLAPGETYTPTAETVAYFYPEDRKHAEAVARRWAEHDAAVEEDDGDVSLEALQEDELRRRELEEDLEMSE